MPFHSSSNLLFTHELCISISVTYPKECWDSPSLAVVSHKFGDCALLLVTVSGNMLAQVCIPLATPEWCPIIVSANLLALNFCTTGLAPLLRLCLQGKQDQDQG